jgi:hypothetical protein
MRRRGQARLCLEELEGRLVASAIPATSTNWSGYALNTSPGAVTAVSGQWVVPSAAGTGTAYSSNWVGIDGFSSSTVEQIGTDSDVLNGTPQYYAWYEMYPRGFVQLPLTIHAGDTISASVNYGSSAVTLSLTDATSGQSYTTTQTAPGAQRSSAEWIEEAPSSAFGVLPLANFGKATFAAARATVGGSTAAIDGFSSSAGQLYQLNMVSRSGARLDTTSAVTDSGNPATSSFTVTYAGTSSQPPPHRRWWGWWASDLAVSPPATTTTVTASETTSSAAAAAALLNSGAATLAPAPVLSSPAAAGQPAITTLATTPVALAPPAVPAASPAVSLAHRTDGLAPETTPADQSASPELLPAPRDSGPPESGASSATDAVFEQAAETTSLRDWLGAVSQLDGWTVDAPADVSAMSDGGRDEGRGPGLAGVAFALALGGSWGVLADRAARRRQLLRVAR